MPNAMADRGRQAEKQGQGRRDRAEGTERGKRARGAGGNGVCHPPLGYIANASIPKRMSLIQIWGPPGRWSSKLASLP